MCFKVHLRNLYIFSFNMKRILCNLICFIFPLLLIAIGAEKYARTIPNSYKYKFEWMEHNKHTIETLILGNSSLYSAIIPSLLNHSFNMANSAQSLEIDKWLMSKYIRECPNLKTIILPVDINNLFAEEFKKAKTDGNRAIYYNLYMGYETDELLSLPQYELACPQFITTKIMKYTKAIVEGETFDYQCDSLGRGTYYKRDVKDSLNLTEDKALVQAKKYNYNRLKDRYAYNFKIIEEIVAECKERNIRLILVSTPYWYRFNQLLDKKMLQLFYAKIQELRNVYNVEYEDYREDRRFVKKKKYFKDLRHLSDEGAFYFTNIMKKEKGIE